MEDYSIKETIECDKLFILEESLIWEVPGQIFRLIL